MMKKNLIHILAEAKYVEQDYLCVYKHESKNFVFLTHTDDIAVAYKDKDDVATFIQIMENSG